MKCCKNQKGITTISLIVTIIVLTIIAGIIIGSLSQKNDIITESNKTKKTVQIQALEEQIDATILQVENEMRKPTIDDIIKRLVENNIIESTDKVNKATGSITTKEPEYVIEGKLEDYIK